ncbi:MAG: ABC transporter permease [Candidatus Hydrogenedens sp.]|nr:ABC transporter permease [Candidatus Hydrogenedens sp.]
MIKYFWEILKEEYNAIFSDPGILMIVIAGLSVYTMVYPLPYSPEVLKELKVVAADRDNTALSRKLLRWIDATEEVTIYCRVADFNEAKELITAGKAYGVIVIPDEFEKNVLTRKRSVVQLFADASYFLIYRQIFTGVYKATATLSAGVEIRRLTAEGMTEPYAQMKWNIVNTDVRALFNPVGGYATYVVPGVLMLILQQTLLIGIGILTGTRQEQYESLPLPEKGERPIFFCIILARGFAYFSMYIFFPFFYMLVIYRIYNLPQIGNLPEVMLFLIPYVSSIILLGFTLCTIFVSREISIPALIFTSIPTVLLVGFAWPLETLPQWLRWFSLLFPSTSGSAGFVRMNHMGASLYEVRWEWFTLWGLNFLYFTTAWLSFRLYHYRIQHKQLLFTEHPPLV